MAILFYILIWMFVVREFKRGHIILL